MLRETPDGLAERLVSPVVSATAVAGAAVRPPVGSDAVAPSRRERVNERPTGDSAAAVTHPLITKPYGIATAAAVAIYPLCLAVLAAPVAAIVAGTLGLALALRGARRRALLVLPAIAPALVPGAAPRWAWALGAASLTLAYVGPGGQHAGELADESALRMERHLSRCRRHGRGAHLLVAFVPGAPLDTGPKLLAALRTTDDGAVVHDAWAPAIAVLVEDGAVDRPGLHERLANAVDRPLHCGWAVFPDDGLTLDQLQACASDRQREVQPTPAPLDLELARRAS